MVPNPSDEIGWLGLITAIFISLVGTYILGWDLFQSVISRFQLRLDGWLGGHLFVHELQMTLQVDRYHKPCW